MGVSELASEIVAAVLSDLGGRAGVGNELDSIDSDIKEEMTQELEEIVKGLILKQHD